MRYKGVIFDFNGVLLWDTHLHEQAWMVLSKKLRGYPFSDEEMTNVIQGSSNREVLQYLLKRNISNEELEDLSFEKESLYRTLCLKNGKEFQLSPGATELLDFLVKNTIPHTIATLAVKENLDFFIKHLHLQKWFDLSQIVFDNGAYSDKKDMYIQAAKNLNLSPKECVVIEDSKHGMRAAFNAKVGKIIALTPKHEQGSLIPKGVSQIIYTLSEFDRGQIQLNQIVK